MYVARMPVAKRIHRDPLPGPSGQCLSRAPTTARSCHHRRARRRRRPASPKWPLRPSAVLLHVSALYQRPPGWPGEVPRVHPTMPLAAKLDSETEALSGRESEQECYEREGASPGDGRGERDVTSTAPFQGSVGVDTVFTRVSIENTRRSNQRLCNSLGMSERE